MTGDTKRALFLIIENLGDVSQAIAFAKAQNDKDLWNDLLEYSMDKPRFICGLLEEVGTAIDPVTLVRRIPEGLQIEGLKDGLSKMLKEYELQYSISEGVAKILRGEVASAMEALRTGQKKGIKFEIGHGIPGRNDATAWGDEHSSPDMASTKAVAPDFSLRSGACRGCLNLLAEDGQYPYAPLGSTVTKKES